MKHSLSVFLLAMTLLIAQPLYAEEKAPDTFNYKQGFQLGFELNGLVNTGLNYGVGKVDLIAGYRFNPYFSLNADLWTIYLIAYGVELNPRIHFPTRSKASPYLGISAGWMSFGFFETLAEEIIGEKIQLFTFSAGPGVDIELGNHMTLNVALKYRGIASLGDDSGYANALEGGAGLRWTF